MGVSDDENVDEVLMAAELYTGVLAARAWLQLGSGTEEGLIEEVCAHITKYYWETLREDDGA
jgi:hypothetical protein